MKAFRIFLLILIIIGLGLLVTQKVWVPKLVDQVLKSENGWKTYTDSTQRFTIKYPSGLHSVVNARQDYVVFCPMTNKECSSDAVYVYVYPKGGSKDILNDFRTQGSVYKEKNVVVNGTTGIQREESYCNGTPLLTNGVFIEGSANDFQVQGPYYECGSAKEEVFVHYDESEKTFYQMLSTFKTN